jgi:hypothetical protein
MKNNPSIASTSRRMHKQRIGGCRRWRTLSRPPDRRSWSPKDVRTVVQIVDPRSLRLARRCRRQSHSRFVWPPLPETTALRATTGGGHHYRAHVGSHRTSLWTLAPPWTTAGARSFGATVAVVRASDAVDAARASSNRHRWVRGRVWLARASRTTDVPRSSGNHCRRSCVRMVASKNKPWRSVTHFIDAGTWLAWTT